MKKREEIPQIKTKIYDSQREKKQKKGNDLKETRYRSHDRTDLEFELTMKKGNNQFFFSKFNSNNI